MNGHAYVCVCLCVCVQVEYIGKMQAREVKQRLEWNAKKSKGQMQVDAEPERKTDTRKYMRQEGGIDEILGACVRVCVCT